MGGDGYGWYVVTRATKSTVDVAYRGFGPDEWQDKYIESRGRKRVPMSYAGTLVYRALKPIDLAIAAETSAADNAMRAAMESPD